MDLFIGFMMATILFGCSIGGFLVGKMTIESCDKQQEETKEKELDENIKREQLKQIRGMNNVLSYDVDVAMGVREQHE